METNISRWLEQRTGVTKRQMALQTGQTPSTFNRNIETAEVIIAVCRQFGINPIEGLTAAQLITDAEVTDAAGETNLRTVSERALLEEVLRRVGEREDVNDVSPLQLVDSDPDYSKMSDEDVRNSYDLAALAKPEHIGDDELPHEP